MPPHRSSKRAGISARSPERSRFCRATKQSWSRLLASRIVSPGRPGGLTRSATRRRARLSFLHELVTTGLARCRRFVAPRRLRRLVLEADRGTGGATTAAGRGLHGRLPWRGLGGGALADWTTAGLRRDRRRRSRSRRRRRRTPGARSRRRRGGGWERARDAGERLRAPGARRTIDPTPERIELASDPLELAFEAVDLAENFVLGVLGHVPSL
jgi:hypothetical protein